MRKYPAVVLAALVSMMSAMLIAGPAQAYPQQAVHIHFHVDHQVVHGGSTVTGFTSADVRCDWTVTFLSQSASGSGKRFRHEFATPKVHKRTVYPMRATCRYTSSQGDPKTWTGTIPITVVPTGDPLHQGAAGAGVNAAPPAGGALSGLLPNTGGPAFWVLLAGLALLLGGAGVLLSSRRRTGSSRAR